MISSHPDVLAADAAGSMALGNQLARAARLYPDRVALQFDDVRRTWARREWLEAREVVNGVRVFDLSS